MLPETDKISVLLSACSVSGFRAH